MKKIFLSLVVLVLVSSLSGCLVGKKKPYLSIVSGTFVSGRKEQVLLQDIIVNQIICEFKEIEYNEEFENPIICKTTDKKFAIYLTIDSNYEVKETKCRFITGMTNRSGDSYEMNISIDLESFNISFDCYFIFSSWIGFENKIATFSINSPHNITKNGESITRDNKLGRIGFSLYTLEQDLAYRILGDDVYEKSA